MSDGHRPIPDLGFDPEAIRAKYAAEAAKREGRQAPSRTAASSPTVSVEDRFAEPFERAPLFDEVDAVVVGGGFAGLIAGAHLRRAGVERVRLIDKAGGFGGVWYWNRYPGIRCDVDCYSYLPLLEDVDTVPSEKYVQGDEIREHCERVAKAFGLDESACLQTQVTGMRWDEGTSRWLITTDRGDEMRAKFVCLGSGTLDVPAIPDVPGLQSFEGRVFHSSRWDYDYTGGDCRGGLDKLAGKRVAAVGTAASAIQFIPHLAEHAEHVTVFQRTPVVILRRGNSQTDPEWYRNQEPGWQHERMENFTRLTQPPPGERPPEDDLVDDTTTRLFRWIRNPGELNSKLEGLDMPTRMLYVNHAAMEQVRADMASVVDDPAIGEAVKPYYALGCKRPQFSDDYLQTFNRPNVTLVDTQGRGIERMTPNGIVFDGVEHEVDCVVFGTGFAIGGGRGHAGEFPVVGRAGELLSEKWAAGARSLHGVMSAGFPNLFLIGNIAQAAHSFTFSYVLEAHSEYASTIVKRSLAEGVASVEPRPEAEQNWAEQIKARAAELPRIDLGCTLDEHQRLVHSGHPGGPVEYARICRAWLDDGYERDLVIERSADAQPA